jgi:hypothetical protein
MAGWIVWVLVVFFLPAVLVWWAVWPLSRRLSCVSRTAALVISGTLLLTPSWGPATIVAVPVPFGFLLGVTLFTGSWSELASLVNLFPTWHLVAFPATATALYVAVRLLLSNQRFKPTGHASGAAGGLT